PRDRTAPALAERFNRTVAFRRAGKPMPAANTAPDWTIDLDQIARAVAPDVETLARAITNSARSQTLAAMGDHVAARELRQQRVSQVSCTPSPAVLAKSSFRSSLIPVTCLD